MNLSKIENYLKNEKKLLSYDNEFLLEKIQFKFMKELYENNIPNIEIFELIQRIKIEKSLKNVNYYQLRNFRNILHKRQNMRIFYYQTDENEYQLYLSFNLNDKRFKNKKIENITHIELIKILNHYSKIEREMKIA